ncbi:TBC1 domain family member 2B-like isoform X2 [Dysidea avara]|uniref:TBC1 domain family member 2B-like isoform X2 n=1 Tax=Dysidea avara TaxID=196820 RepID=UPI003333555F
MSSGDHASPTADQDADTPPQVSIDSLIPPSEVQQHKLCGYLNKQSATPGLKALKKWISRYCVFSEEECKLILYNSKTDSTSQGSIDISNASFLYHISNPAQFTIVTGKQDHVMLAHSQEAMMYWLTVLQRKRRQFSERRKRSQSATLLQENTSGLVGTADKGSYDHIPAPDYIQEPIGSNTYTTGSSNKQGATWIKSLKIPSLILPKRSPIPLPSFVSQPSRSPPGSSSTIRDNSPSGEQKQDDTSEFGDTMTRQSKRTINFDWLKKGIKRSSCEHCNELQLTIARLERELSHRQQELQGKDELNQFLKGQIRDNDLKGKAQLTLEAHMTSEYSQDDMDKDRSILVLQQSLDNMSRVKSRVDDELSEAQLMVTKLQEEITSYQEIIMIKDNVVMGLTHQLEELQKLHDQLPEQCNQQDQEHSQQQDQQDHQQYGQEQSLPDQQASQQGQQNEGHHPDQLSQENDQETDQYQQQTSNTSSVTNSHLPKGTAAQCYSEVEKLREAVEAYKEKNMFLANEILEMNRLRSDDADLIAAKSQQNDQLQKDLTRIQSRYLVLLEEMKKPKMSMGGQLIESESPINPDLVHQMLEDAMETIDTVVESSGYYDSYGFNHKHLLEDSVAVESVSGMMNQQLQQMQDTTTSRRVQWLHYMNDHHGNDFQPTKELKQMIRWGIPANYRSKIWSWCIRHHLGRELVLNKYRSILEENASRSSVAVNQIELDLLRTLPNNQHYHSADDMGRVLKDLMIEKLPKLTAHLDHHKVDFSPVTFNWFLTVYVDTVPTETMLQIWDAFLYEGSKVLFRYAIALFKNNEEQLLKLDNTSAVFNQVRRIGKLAYDPQRLSQIAFRELHSFPMRVVNQKRALHVKQVEAEQEQVSRERERYRRLSEHRRRKGSDNDNTTDQS